MAASFRALGSVLGHSLLAGEEKLLRWWKELTEKGSHFGVWYIGFSKDFVHRRRCCAASNFGKDSEIAGRCQSVGSEITEFRKWSSSAHSRAIELALQLPTLCIFCIEWLYVNNAISFMGFKAIYQLEAGPNIGNTHTYPFASSTGVINCCTTKAALRTLHHCCLIYVQQMYQLAGSETLYL